jgi:hypothetical protein
MCGITKGYMPNKRPMGQKLGDRPFLDKLKNRDYPNYPIFDRVPRSPLNDIPPPTEGKPPKFGVL